MSDRVQVIGSNIKFKNGESEIFNMTADESQTLNIGNGKIKTAASDFTSTQLVTKQYVDNVARGLDVKESVRFATTGPLGNYDPSSNTFTAVDLTNPVFDLGGLQSLQEGDRVLVKDQADLYQNGIYVVTAGSILTRAADFNDSSYVTKGAFTFVYDGDKNKNTGYAVSSLGFNNVFVLNASDTTGTIVFTIISSQADNYKNASLINTGTLESVRLEIHPSGGLMSTSNGLSIASGANGVTNAMLAGGIINSKLSTQGKIPFTTTAATGLSGSGITVTNDTTSDNFVLGESVNFSIGSSAIENGMIASGVDGAKLVAASVDNTKLANNDVTVTAGSGLQSTSNTIALGGSTTMSIANSGVVTTMIADQNVTNSKLANPSLTVNTTVGSGLAGGATVALGTSTDLSIAPLGVVTSMIADDAVTNDKIAAPTVSIATTDGLTGAATVNLGGSTTLGIADGGLVNAKIAAGTIENDRLSTSGQFTLNAGNGLTGAGVIALGDTTPTISIATNGVTNTMINDVNGGKIATGTVANDRLVNNTVKINPILNGGIATAVGANQGANEVALGSQLDIKIADQGVINAMIKDADVSITKLVHYTTTVNVESGVLSTTKAALNLGESTTLSIVDRGVTGTKLALNTVLNENLQNTQMQLAAGDGLTVTNGGVMTLGRTGALTAQTMSISAGGVTNAMLGGSITNDKLVNSLVTVTAGTGLTGGGAVSLGAAITINTAQDISPTSDVTFLSVTTTSDPRLKANMTPLEKPLEMIDSMNGYSFNWKYGADKTSVQYGLNADEVESVNKDLVKLGEDGYKSVNYNSVIAILLGAIKDLKAEVAELRASVA